MEQVVLANASAVAATVAEVILQRAQGAERASKAYHLVLSGGRTPVLLFELMGSEGYAKKFPWKCLQLWWADERCVPPEHPESNFAAVKKALISRVPLTDGQIHRMRGETEPMVEALRYEKEIGKTRFDTILLGMGDDGHTASLFPERELLTKLKLTGVAEHPKTRQKRVTLTMEAINSATEVFFVVTGADKSDVVRAILRGEKGAEVYPAGAVKPLTGRLTWYLDSGAASKL
jgi:6-phosphogluconolactonase